MFSPFYATAKGFYLTTSLYITTERWLSQRPNLWMCPRVKKEQKSKTERKGDGRRNILCAGFFSG